MYGNEEILEALLRLEPDIALPREGPCAHLYRNFIDRDEIMLFAGEDALHVLYFNSYEVIEAVDDTPPGVFIEPWGNAVMVLIVVSGIDDPTVMRFTLDPDNQLHRQYAGVLKRTGRIRLHLLTLVEGGLHRMKAREVTVPPETLSVIP